MSELPPLVPFGALGSWEEFIEGLYGLYIKTIVRAELTFGNLPVRCQFRPETFGKHFAFWHMMQEDRVEDERTIDPERCRRLLWISWVIQSARADSRIRVFPQALRGSDNSWVLWLYEEGYAVILHERNGYFLLKTAFMVKPHKAQEFERDWRNYDQKD